MLTKCSSHAEFKQFLRQQVPLLWALEKDRFLYFSRSLTKVWFLNLDPAVALLSGCFSSMGRPVLYDAVCILRSLVLMLDLGYHSVTKWVDVLRSDVFWLFCPALSLIKRQVWERFMIFLIGYGLRIGRPGLKEGLS